MVYGFTGHWGGLHAARINSQQHSRAIVERHKQTFGRTNSGQNHRSSIDGAHGDQSRHEDHAVLHVGTPPSHVLSAGTKIMHLSFPVEGEEDVFAPEEDPLVLDPQ